MKAHPVFVAQRATANCWRGYIKKWHGIGKGRALSEKEIKFVVDLVMGSKLHVYNFNYRKLKLEASD